MNGCKHTITGVGQLGLTTQADITGCTAGKQIEITTATCTATVPEQHHVSDLVLTNIAGSPHDLLAHLTFTSIKYEAHGACPSLPATTLTTNGQYIGTATLRAREAKGSEQKTHNGHAYQKLL